MNSARLPVSPYDLATQEPRGFHLAWTVGVLSGRMPQRVETI